MPAYVIIYMGSPCANFCANHASQELGSLLAKPAIVAGINKIELAKMGGITPAVFTFNGMFVDDAMSDQKPNARRWTNVLANLSD